MIHQEVTTLPIGAARAAAETAGTSQLAAGRGRIQGLDGMRGIAILAVMLFHFPAGRTGA